MASQMLAEIQEQPRTLARLLAEGWPQVEAAAAAARAAGVRYVLIAARGSSDNAARYGKYLFGALNRLPVALAVPSLYTVYHTPPRSEGALVIGLSQSGRAADVAEVIRQARAEGAATLAITNYPDSPLGLAAERHILLRAGEERSIPATKTYTAQLLALAMLCAALAPEGPAPDSGNRGLAERRAELAGVPQRAEEALSLQPEIEAVAAAYRDARHLLVIGRGFNFSTAYEIALKVEETCYLPALPFSSADFRHGPLSLVEPGLPALVLAPSGQVQAELLALARDLRAWGPRVIVIGDGLPPDLPGPPGPTGEVPERQRQGAAGAGDHTLHLPPGTPEWLSPLPLTVTGQLFALGLARARRLDPDRPRRLQKVTITY